MAPASTAPLNGDIRYKNDCGVDLDHKKQTREFPPPAVPALFVSIFPLLTVIFRPPVLTLAADFPLALVPPPRPAGDGNDFTASRRHL